MVHKTGFEPLAEDDFVHGDVSEEPVMRDFIEARLDIALQDPFGRLAFTQRDKALLDRIRGGPLLPKAIGVGVPGGLRNGLKRLQVQSLHGQVHFARHTHSTLHLYPNPLWNM